MISNRPFARSSAAFVPSVHRRSCAEPGCLVLIVATPFLPEEKPMRVRLSQRLLLLMLAAMIPLLAAFSYVLISLKVTREREATDEAFRNGQLAALEIQRIISGFESVLITLSSAPSIRTLDQVNCASLLSSAASRLPGVATLGVIDSEGVVRCRHDSRGLGLSLRDRRYFQEAMKSDKMVVATYVKSRITGRAILPLALRITDEHGTPIGMIGLSVDLEWLQQRLAERSYSPGSSITLADREGTVVARYPFPERFVGTRIPQEYRHLVDDPTPGSLEVTSQDGTRRILAYFPVSAVPEGLYLSTGISTDEVYSPVQTATAVAIGAASVAILLSLLLAWQTSRHAIARPMRRITSTLDHWRQGRRSERTGMMAVDEFSEVGAAINSFMDELEAARRQQELLVAELGHRVKNILATVQSVARQTFVNGGTDRGALDSYTARLNAMGNAFDLLTTDSWRSADLHEIVVRATQPFDRSGSSRFVVEGPVYLLDSKGALAFSMAIHELCTNASKYGALSTAGGVVDICWRRDGSSGLIFRWKESGGPAVKPPTSTGFGTRMIERVLASQVGATVRTDYSESGFGCEIHLAACPTSAEEEDQRSCSGQPQHREACCRQQEQLWSHRFLLPVLRLPHLGRRRFSSGGTKVQILERRRR
jgi:two-component sensor histidine kinase